MKYDEKSISRTCKSNVNSINFALQGIFNAIKSQPNFWELPSTGKVMVEAVYAAYISFSILQPKIKYQL